MLADQKTSWNRGRRDGRFVLCGVLWAVLWSGAAEGVDAADVVAFRHDGAERTVEGKLIVTAEDGGLMLLGADGRIWPVKPDELIAKTTNDKPWAPMDAKQVVEELKRELPDGFRYRTTKNYVVAYTTSEAYAEWTAALFERFYSAFTNYWTQRKFELTEPEFPMVAVVFADRESFVQFARPELGEAVTAVIGYYSFRTNRMIMYDLTGVEALRAPGERGKASDVNQLLSRPQAERTVATIVHEATHQIAFNTGLQRRYSDNPMWVSEGLALYFESPDLRSARGWRNIGSVNGYQLGKFTDYLRRRPPGAIVAVLTDDRRLRDSRTSTDAYAESWALNYYLMQARSKQYHDYLKLLSQKPTAVWDTPEQRIADFKKVFGDLEGFERDYLRYVNRWLR